MTNSQVTITLGRSGRKVVKRGKRYLPESIKSSSGHSVGYSKMMTTDVSVRTYGNRSRVDEYHIGPKDLRTKLMQKRNSRFKNEERKKKEQQEKVSRAIRFLESPNQAIFRNVSSAREAAPIRARRVDSLRSSPFQISDGLRLRSTDQLLISSDGNYTPRSSINKLSHVLHMRPGNDSRTGHVLLGNPLDSSRSKVPMPIMPRHFQDSDKLVTAATAGTHISPYPDRQLLTVNDLLHALGLEKYSIIFQAEEIDMVALKQMGDVDLKELGIPMGPRKKILLALLARPVLEAHS